MDVKKRHHQIFVVCTKTNGAKAQSPRLFHVLIYEDLTRCIFLYVKFRNQNQAMHFKPANQNFFLYKQKFCYKDTHALKFDVQKDYCYKFQPETFWYIELHTKTSKTKVRALNKDIVFFFTTVRFF